MNTIKISAICIILYACAVLTNAQTYEDVLRYSQPQYSGTARSMSMGGAFGSLGGDFSALGINPAGIATYRSSEFTLTPSLIINSTETDFSGNKLSDNKTSFVINQIGYVGTYRPMREVKKGVVSTHFAIGYNRNNNFNYKSMASGRNISSSMTDMFVTDANGIHPDDLGGLTALAYDTYLIDIQDEANNTYTNFLYAEDKVDQTKLIEKDGYSGEFNLTTGANISNLLLIGASLNFTSMRYKENANYYEQYSENNGEPAYDVFSQYSINNYLNASGTGVNLKFGLIIKPVSNARLGFSYHSPTWYKIEEDYGSTVNASYFNHDNSEGYYDGRFDYKLNTPEKLIASAAYIIGKVAILSFDYEYINYASSKFKANSNSYQDFEFINEQNRIIKETFTATNNFRAGAEFRLNEQVSFRGGYSFQASPYKTEPFDNEITSITGGLGYRNSNYFIDLAYKLSSYDTSYYNYWYDEGIHSPETKVSAKDHYAVITFGWKF
ncbi:hydrocarbon degradation protein [Labilibacter sediminis]|nr:hydrocarbon degradation protein [Labilibacter sediminis]